VDFKWDTKGLQTIVGVIADMREGPLNAPATPAIYIPVAQRPSDAMFLVVRAAGDPTSIVPSIRSVMRAVDSHLPLANIRTLDEIVGADVASQRLTTSILAIFAALALLLAAVGLYGVISYSVLQRTQELGVRAALGARRKDLMRLVLSQSAGFTTAGIILGGIGALAIGQLIAHQLFGVRAADSMTFMFVVVLLALVAALASAVPALRATRADPLAALRQE
jgi:putative ABC transport system permease protein